MRASLRSIGIMFIKLILSKNLGVHIPATLYISDIPYILSKKLRVSPCSLRETKSCSSC